MGMFDQPRGMFAVDDRDTSSLGGILMDYLRSVMSGQVAAGGALGQNNYDPSKSFAQNALNPRAIEQATDIGMGVSGGGLGIKAYHGSPHDFDKFDLAKIGTGEGAQAYGHGLYFAEKEAVARGYKDDLGALGAMDALDGFLKTNQGLQLPAADIAMRLRDTRAAPLATDDKAVQALRDLLPNYSPGAAVTNAELQHYRYLNDAAERLIPGKMYEVDINANPDAFLNWDKPLSAQPGQVQQAVRSFSDVFPGIGKEVVPGMEPAGKHLYEQVARATTPNVDAGWAAASGELKQAGIPGIRYLDQGSRGAAEGTSNYVVFNPDIISILRKYGIMGPMAVPGALMPFMGDPQQ